MNIARRPKFSPMSLASPRLFNNIPKINYFIWLLVHGHILTVENMKKRSISEPSRCALYSQDEETIPHMFAQCPYATATWNLVLGNLFILTTQALSYKDFFQNWGKNYHGNLRNKPGLNKLWIEIPKYIYWEIWLAQNKKIFQKETISPRQCVVKSISLCVEYM